MITAKKSRTFHTMFSLIHQRLVATSFEQIYWRASEDITNKQGIFVANHSSWWDGLIYFHLTRTVLQQDLYIMMHETGLKQFPYFKRLGAFSIDREHPKEILLSLQYAEQLLENGKSVWLFPQGDEFHLEIRPLRFQPGAVYLAEKCPLTPIIPISFYYSFGHKRKPEMWISADRPLYYQELEGGSRKLKTAALEEICTIQLDDLKQTVMNREHHGFSPLL